MDTGVDKDRVLRGLLARLALDSDLGSGYVSESKKVFSIIEQIASSRENAPNSTSGVHPKPASRDPSQSGKKSAAPARNLSEPPVRPPEPQRRTGTRVSLVPYVEPPPNPEKEAALASLRSECMTCGDCALCERRNTVVWGEGDLSAKVMFIGEGPGRDEDVEGRPFVGASGRLLTDIIEKGMRTPRSRVYIANVVKCRPPGNRDPLPEEVAACSRYLTRQIEVISPKVIVAVGSVAGRTLLRRDGSPGLRGAWHQYNGVPMRIIYHPSYLLRMRRNENDRTAADRTTWNDIQEVMARITSGDPA